jgi:hypothetical protein
MRQIWAGVAALNAACPDVPAPGWHTRCVTTAVLLISREGIKEFVRDSHIHGIREGRLLLATGRPGAGLDANITREVDLADLAYAETVQQEADTPEAETGSDWAMGWGSSEDRPN